MDESNPSATDNTVSHAEPDIGNPRTSATDNHTPSTASSTSPIPIEELKAENDDPSSGDS